MATNKTNISSMLQRPSQTKVEEKGKQLEETTNNESDSTPRRSLSQLLVIDTINSNAELESVKRNFNIQKGNMRKLKLVVQMLLNQDIKTTQDDVLNDILDEWFEEKGIK